MESGRGPLRQAFAAFAATSLVMAACASPAPDAVSSEVTIAPVAPGSSTEPTPTPSIPDITMRAISTADLAAVLSDAATVRDRSNESLIVGAVFDRQDQSADVVLFGRSTGVAADYERADGSAHVWIDVLADSGSAHDYLHDAAGDIAKGVDGTHSPDSALDDVTEFPITAGQEAVGLSGTLRANGATETLVISRIGRLVIFASEVRPGDADMRVAVQYLVDEILADLIEHLTGDSIEVVPPPPGYRFQTTITVASADESWTTTASGTIDGPAHRCEVERISPGASPSAELVALGGRVWMQVANTGFIPASAANATVIQLDMWCPIWPLEVSDAGLRDLATAADPPRHHVNGVDAAGYQGETGDLSKVMGTAMPGVTVDTFSFWVADGSEWIVELAIVASGPASSLVALTGVGFEDVGEITVSLRHRVFDLGDVDPIVPPN